MCTRTHVRYCPSCRSSCLCSTCWHRSEDLLVVRYGRRRRPVGPQGQLFGALSATSDNLSPIVAHEVTLAWCVCVCVCVWWRSKATGKMKPKAQPESETTTAAAATAASATTPPQAAPAAQSRAKFRTPGLVATAVPTVAIPGVVRRLLRAAQARGEPRDAPPTPSNSHPPVAAQKQRHPYVPHRTESVQLTTDDQTVATLPRPALWQAACRIAATCSL